MNGETVRTMGVVGALAAAGLFAAPLRAAAADQAAAAEAQAADGASAEEKPAARGRRAKPGGVMGWFANLKQGLAMSAVGRYHQRRRADSVAAVRGAKRNIEDPARPYIKDPADAALAKQDSAERAELAAAVDLIMTGRSEEGRRKLDEFEAAHPDSAYLQEARKAKEMMQGLAPAAAPAAEGGAAPAAPPAQGGD